jgi:peptidoglycan hydrolase-like protein with peptidoglycan-binding domain
MRSTVHLGATALAGAILAASVALAPPAAASSYWSQCIALGKTTWHSDGSSWTIPTTQLSSGSNNACVRFAQQQLNQWEPNANLAVDGVFGSQTLAATKAFQRRFSPIAGPVDGIIGPKTWSRLVLSPN